MPTTRCKFKCTEVTKRTGWADIPFIHDAKFQAVTEGSEDNKKFFAATPSGNLHVGTVREGTFEAGKEYYLDITPVE